MTEPDAFDPTRALDGWRPPTPAPAPAELKLTSLLRVTASLPVEATVQLSSAVVERDAFDPTHLLDGWRPPAPAPLDLELRSPLLHASGAAPDEAKMARLKARGYEMLDVEDIELPETGAAPPRVVGALVQEIPAPLLPARAVPRPLVADVELLAGPPRSTVAEDIPPPFEVASPAAVEAPVADLRAVPPKAKPEPPRGIQDIEPPELPSMPAVTEDTGGPAETSFAAVEASALRSLSDPEAAVPQGVPTHELVVDPIEPAEEPPSSPVVEPSMLDLKVTVAADEVLPEQHIADAAPFEPPIMSVGDAAKSDDGPLAATLLEVPVPDLGAAVAPDQPAGQRSIEGVGLSEPPAGFVAEDVESPDEPLTSPEASEPDLGAAVAPDEPAAERHGEDVDLPKPPPVFVAENVRSLDEPSAVVEMMMLNVEAAAAPDEPGPQRHGEDAGPPPDLFRVPAAEDVMSYDGTPPSSAAEIPTPPAVVEVPVPDFHPVPPPDEPDPRRIIETVRLPDVPPSPAVIEVPVLDFRAAPPPAEPDPRWVIDGIKLPKVTHPPTTVEAPMLDIAALSARTPPNPRLLAHWQPLAWTALARRVAGASTEVSQTPDGPRVHGHGPQWLCALWPPRREDEPLPDRWPELAALVDAETVADALQQLLVELPADVRLWSVELETDWGLVAELVLHQDTALRPGQARALHELVAAERDARQARLNEGYAQQGRVARRRA